ncbi:hypothetical protein CEXT_185661 [Caerostris extrusa]|uniref:Uncharacterized protein n=1 Tax=Caerostris extrusa TaxID=172846 RepID=A0AAV4NBC2_CAEEX|nr:hypothetical protein CEXT_185661 [Caerostris extrusa]
MEINGFDAPSHSPNSFGGKAEPIDDEQQKKKMNFPSENEDPFPSISALHFLMGNSSSSPVVHRLLPLLEFR